MYVGQTIPDTKRLLMLKHKAFNFFCMTADIQDLIIWQLSSRTNIMLCKEIPTEESQHSFETDS